MAMMRSKCQLTHEICVSMLRGHVEGLEDRNFCSADPEEVVEQYTDFLMSAGACTPRLNGATDVKACGEVFGGAPQTHKLFKDRICDAFMYCRKKGIAMVTGSKLSPPVKNIVRAMFPEKFGSSKPSPCKTGGNSDGSLDAPLRSTGSSSADEYCSPL